MRSIPNSENFQLNINDGQNQPENDKTGELIPFPRSRELGYVSLRETNVDDQKHALEILQNSLLLKESSLSID